MKTASRAEHLQWCKDRALQYCDMNDPLNAWASMTSDLQKEESTANHIGITLGMRQMMSGMLSTADEMREFIKGFN